MGSACGKLINREEEVVLRGLTCWSLLRDGILLGRNIFL
jgi:hypothetical protein